ncbi:hypothetical protein QTP86_001144 [Hemibagrus guttatus]|nr:hypothetical protein QTP86_001144 [Hemibagrus guttatus]
MLRITSTTPTSLASKQHIPQRLPHAARSAKLSSVLILLDLSAAFDTVNYKTLLSTLRSLGICGTAWEWFASYLDGYSYQIIKAAVSLMSSGVALLKFFVFMVTEHSKTPEAVYKQIVIQEPLEHC